MYAVNVLRKETTYKENLPILNGKKYSKDAKNNEDMHGKHTHTKCDNNVWEGKHGTKTKQNKQTEMKYTYDKITGEIFSLYIYIYI